MEDEFEKLKKQGKNTADGLVKWLKDSKIVEDKKAEESIRKTLSEVNDVKNIELAKFQEALQKLAREQHKNIEELVGKLKVEAPRFLDAVSAGVSAFKDALTGKK